jgi:hypothetical protein
MLLPLKLLEYGPSPQPQAYDGFIETPASIAQPPQPWTGTPLPLLPTLYRVGQQSLTSCGDPYISAASAIGAGRFTGSNPTLLVAFQLDALPTSWGDPDGVQWLVSFHEAVLQGKELFSIGVTPSGRVVSFMAGFGGGFEFSPINSVDVGNPHYVQIEIAGPNRYMIVDNVVLAVDSSLHARGPISLSNPGTERLMLFNGVQGTSEIAASISQVTYTDGNGQITWNLADGSGLTVSSSGTYPSAPLTLARYDPTPFGYPTIWGPVSNASPLACLKWGRSVAYRNITPAPPVYRPVQGSGQA